MFDKESLIRSFEAMREIEISARDYYLNLVQEPVCRESNLDGQFEGIARDEENHDQILQKIINIIKNNL